MAEMDFAATAESVERSLLATAETLVELAGVAVSLRERGESGLEPELKVLVKVVLECNQAVLSGMTKCLELSQARGRS